ncbi:MAG: hypothetical protein EOO27_11670 [Comamonadaceae bacterium]|nr:MAG: hypothetical protein EOO27_11670 [Comamonadaceae bacterium]
MTVRYELVGVDAPNSPQYRWEFGAPDCPLRLATTPTGLGGAPMVHARQSNARQPGASWRGRNDDINTIELNVRVGPVPPAQALEVWQAWRQSLGRGDKLAEFHVYSELGHTFQYVRLEKEIPAPDFAALEWLGEVTETAILTSDESWWRSDPVDVTYNYSSYVQGTKITNEGDVPGWMRYEITGPGTFTIGVGGEYNTLPTLAAGETWIIETDAEDPYIRNTAGVDKWNLVGLKAWYKPVPAGSTVPLDWVVSGGNANTKARFVLPQKYTTAVPL